MRFPWYDALSSLRYQGDEWLISYLSGKCNPVASLQDEFSVGGTLRPKVTERISPDGDVLIKKEEKRKKEKKRRKKSIKKINSSFLSFIADFLIS